MAELKPTSYPDWATDNVTLPVAGTANKIEPRSIMQTQGADKGNFFGAQEANWILNSNGKWVRYLAQEVQHLNDTNLREYPSVADMVADAILVEGDYVRTLGYHVLGDTGGAIYEVVSSGLADGMTTIALDNGLLASFVYTSNTFSPMQFGAVGDGTTDDSIPMQKMLDLGEDNLSNTTLNKGIIVDLSTRNYAVEVTFQSKTTIKNGTLSQTIANVNILQYIGAGTGKSVGWEYLHLEDVTFDGRGLGSGNSNTADGTNNPDDMVKNTTNIGLCIDTTSIGANTYNLVLEGCTFQNLYNSNLFYENNNIYTEDPILTVDDCTFRRTVSSDPSTINLVVKTDPSGSGTELTLQFKINKSDITCDGAVLFTDYFCKVIFNECTITGTTQEATSFLGASNFTLANKSILNLGTTIDGGNGYLARNGYNIDITDSEVYHTFDVLRIQSNVNNTVESTFITRGSSYSWTIAVDKKPQGGGTRVGCKVIAENNTFKSALYITPDSEITSISLAPQQGMETGMSDEVRLIGNKIGSYSAIDVGRSYRSVLVACMSQQIVDFICTGNIVYYNGSISASNSLIHFDDPSPTLVSITGNTFQNSGNLSGSALSIVSLNFPNLDTEHHMALAGNMVRDATYLLRSEGSVGDATNLPLNYNR